MSLEGWAIFLGQGRPFQSDVSSNSTTSYQHNALSVQFLRSALVAEVPHKEHANNFGEFWGRRAYRESMTPAESTSANEKFGPLRSDSFAVQKVLSG